ncbi:MAG TPA: hypothetical protein DIC52_08145 [Candidatus Latescibacteria bacterium]|nr:hypothetical protein [Candidatus Latescibacterota bacterium]
MQAKGAQGLIVDGCIRDLPKPGNWEG